MSINQKVYAYAKGQMGTQVGDGECFALADKALRLAHAKSASDYGTVIADADYKWGRLVDLSKVIQGDIIQFRNYEVRVNKDTLIENDNGSWEEKPDWETMNRPHHTAIVDEIQPHGVIFVLEQNVGSSSKRKTTQRNKLYFKSHIVPEKVTRKGGVVTKVKITVKVTGKIWFYRPVSLR